METEAVGYEFIETPKNQTRDANFELLRIISMFLIVAVHFLNFGGFLEQSVGANHVVAVILNGFFTISVNEFVMISAYFMCKSEKMTVNGKKFWNIWLTVLFYSVICFIIFSAMGRFDFTARNIVKVFLPVIGSQYWFVSSYLVLLLFAPFLNIIIHKITKKQHALICLCIFLLCLFGTDLHFLGLDSGFSAVIPVSNGYSAVWFICLYFIASYIRLYTYNLPPFVNVLLFIFYLGLVALQCFGYSRNYSSVACLTATIIVFVLFRQLKIKNRKLQKAICLLSSLMFGVYIIHINMCISPVLYTEICHTQSFVGSEYSFLIMIGFILATMAVCAAIDFGRQRIFDSIKILADKMIAYKHRKTPNNSM